MTIKLYSPHPLHQKVQTSLNKAADMLTAGVESQNSHQLHIDQGQLGCYNRHEDGIIPFMFPAYLENAHVLAWFLPSFERDANKKDHMFFIVIYNLL